MPKRVLDEETLMPLGLTVKWGGAIAGAYAAFALVQFQVKQHEESIAKLNSAQIVTTQLYAEIDKKLAIIQTKVEYLEKPVKSASRDLARVKTALLAGPVTHSRFEACNAVGPFTVNGR